MKSPQYTFEEKRQLKKSNTNMSINRQTKKTLSLPIILTMLLFLTSSHSNTLLINALSLIGSTSTLTSSKGYSFGYISSTQSSSFLPGNQRIFKSSITTTTIDEKERKDDNHLLTMKVSKGKSKQSRSKGSHIALTNEARMKSAGRRGTKKFLDPNKVFIGNLSYNTTENDLRSFLFDKDYHPKNAKGRFTGGGGGGGLQESNVVNVKIIRDWKTGKSKGYGFIQFVSPIYATSAIEWIKGKRLMGRILRLDQGKKKDVDPLLLITNDKKKKKKKTTVDTEEDVILHALNEAEDNYEEMEVDSEDNSQAFIGELDLDQFDDSILFDDEDEDDDDDDGFQYDGVYIEEFLPDDDDDEKDESQMNREQRREAAKNKKKRRKPGKGFGNIVPVETSSSL